MSDLTPSLPAVLRTRDIQGWEVVDREGAKVGTVADLLVDRGGKIRFIDVEFGFPKKHVLLPNDRVEWGDARLILDSITREAAIALPPYDSSRRLDDDTIAEMLRAYPWMYDPEAHYWRTDVADSRVVPLSDAKEFKIQGGAPDPRGWNVFGSDGERIGTVKQLLVDPSALDVRYLDVDLLDDLFRLGDDRHVLLPIELVDLKTRGNDVWVQNLTAAEIARLPAYTGGPVSAAMEDAVAAATAPGLEVETRVDDPGRVE
jgi:sporulation protein YlmC with PRC-barrel domain